MSNKYKEYYNVIEQNQSCFREMLNKLNSEREVIKQFNIASYALAYATFRGTGYYYSKDLESFYVGIAQALNIDNYDVPYEKNSFLHVMTEAYLTGGHTRVVERWINLSDKDQKHSVVLINNIGIYPELLQENVKSRNGEFYILENPNFLAKAVDLRKLGLNYEYIILHTHMYDPTATMAFGTDKFKRPVILFNHADHMFWIGKSIADIVADIKTINTISKSRKNLDNTFKLGVPIDNRTITLKNKDEARKLLGIPNDKKILLSIGSANKFDPVLGDSIVPFLKKILDSRKDVICYLMGPSQANEYWKNVNQETNGKIIPLGPIDYNKEYFDYINAADLIIDSYPMGGGTALMDCVMSGKPIISFESVFGQFDYITKSQSICHNECDFIEKVLKVLNDEKYAKELSTELRTLFDEENSKKNWLKRLDELIEKTPKVHSVKDLSSEIEPLYIDDRDVVIDLTYGSMAPKNEILSAL